MECVVNGKTYKLIRQPNQPEEYSFNDKTCDGCVAMGDDEEHWQLCSSLPYCRLENEKDPMCG